MFRFKVIVFAKTNFMTIKRRPARPVIIRVVIAQGTVQISVLNAIR